MEREPVLNTYSTRHIIAFVLIIFLSVALFGLLEKLSSSNEDIEGVDLQAEQGEGAVEN